MSPPKKTHCLRGHRRTPDNIGPANECLACRYEYQQLRRLSDPHLERERDKQRQARNRLATARRHRAQRVRDADAIAATAAELTPRQLYQLERAKRVAAGKPVLRTLEERRQAELNRVEPGGRVISLRVSDE